LHSSERKKTRRSNKSAGHTANIVNVVTFVEKARLLMHLLSPGRHFLFLVMSAIKTPAFFTLISRQIKI